MQKKNKYLVFVVSFVFLSVLIPNVEGAWWYPMPRCNDEQNPWFNPGNLLGCCNDECFENNRRCTPSGTSAYMCGDYDLDPCFEWPPEGILDYQTECPYGCFVRGTEGEFESDRCLTENPCKVKSCIPGETRCGRKCKVGSGCFDAGDYVDAVYICKKLEGFNCYGWDFQDVQARECPYGCENGKCLTEGQHDCSSCVPGLRKCDESGSFIIDCIDPDGDGCYHWETDSYEWFYCEYGCSHDYTIDGDAYCVTESGETDCNKCVFGDTRCNPNSDYYLQFCWTKDILGCTSWTTDYSGYTDKPDIYGTSWHREYGAYCPFGCHLGQCRSDPEPPDIDECVLAETRCGGDGSYKVYCVSNPTTGLNEWGHMKKCLSGKCVDGECVDIGREGYSFDLKKPPFPDTMTALGMDSDGWYIYITAHSNPGGVTMPTLYTYNVNGSYIDFCYLNETGLAAGGSTGVTVFRGSPYVRFNASVLTRTDRNCAALSNITLSRSLTGSYQLSSNFTHFFGYNSSEGIAIYNSTGTWINSICLYEDSNVLCWDNHLDFDYYESDKKLYVSAEGFAAGSLCFLDIEIYGHDGYMYGNLTVSEPGECLTGKCFSWSANCGNEPYKGLTVTNDKIYVLWERRSANSVFGYDTDWVMQVIPLTRTCADTCHEGGSKCGGANKEWIIGCIETPDGCWKYFDEVGHLFPYGTYENYMENCGVTQCKERWINHYMLEAYCDDDLTCEDICESDEWGCSLDMKYRVKCIRRPSPIIGNIGRECFDWADPSVDNESEYEFCGMSSFCQNGQCIRKTQQCRDGESICMTR